MQQAPKPATPTIPEPTNDVDGLYRTCMALKQAVERLNAGPRIFVQDTEPVASKDGDFWLSKGGLMSSLSVSINGKWQAVWP
jgi:hypothetical protein